MRQFRDSKSAFTLVELLVVIAIIGVLVALLLPAVQAARESARRIECTNNLKQLGLGFMNYHSARGVFPAGSVTLYVGDEAENFWENWAVSLLPYLEQQSLQDLYNFDVPNSHPDNTAATQTPLKVMTCPSDEHGRELSFPASGARGGKMWAKGSYKAVIGRGKFVQGKKQTYWNDWWITIGGGVDEVPRQWRGPVHLVATPKNPSEGQKQVLATRKSSNLSLLSLNQESIAKITDGTSNTFLAGEYHSLTNVQRTGFWAYTPYGYNEATIIPELGNFALLPDYDACKEAWDKEPCQRVFASLHSGGVINFLACDGSVRGVTDTVDVYVLAAHATIAEGEIATIDN